MLHRPAIVIWAALLVVVAALPAAPDARAQEYQLVPDWPNFPDGMFFGTESGFPDPAAREAAAQRRREAMAAGGQEPTPPPAEPTPRVYGTGVSGIAIDDQDQIYVFNRGVQTVLVFDRGGQLRPGWWRAGHAGPAGDGVAGCTRERWIGKGTSGLSSAPTSAS